MKRIINLIVVLFCSVFAIEVVLAQTDYVDLSNVLDDGEFYEFMSENAIVASGDVTVMSGEGIVLMSKETVTLKSDDGDLHFLSGSGMAAVAGDEAPVIKKTDLDMNWTEIVSYDESGAAVGWSKSYVDGLGRGLQSQSKNMTTGNAMVSQSIYDDLGRPAISTLTVPVNQTQLAYIDKFVVSAADGTSAYSTSDFDGGNLYTPKGVASVDKTLGWYYSSNNTDEPYLDHTSYPYSRTEYSKTQPGAIRKTTLAGDEHTLGSGRELQSYTMQASEYELGQFTEFDSEIEHKGLIKTITVDADGKQSIVYTNREGRTIASCLAGAKTVASLDVTYTAAKDYMDAWVGDTEINYIDIHLPKDNTSVYIEGIVTEVVDLSDDEVVMTGPYEEQSITPGRAGFYRLRCSTNTIVYYEINNYSHYSFNIYDKAGRIKKSYSPKAIENYTPEVHTSYTYNSLGWLMKVSSPDEGITNYVYRADGSIRFSQNSVQNREAGDYGRFSYTEYDDYGRPIESGEYLETDDVRFMDDWNQVSYNVLLTGSFVLPDDANRTQKHKIWYGEDGNEKNQKFVQGVVSKTSYDDNITYYSYTYDGKVDWVIRDHAYVGEKKIEYTYDFLGNVKKVAYQAGQTDEFIHYYEYDKSQRLEKVYTSTKGGTKDLQAKYEYYPHGALKRVELAEDLQGIDYVYNINGLLKSINHASLDSSKDPGGDGNNAFNDDVFGLALDYYSGDYKENSSVTTASGITSNYGGNIAMMRWNQREKIAGTGKGWAYKINYDNRNYLSSAQFGTVTTSSPAFSADGNGAYSVSGLTYDANGNILTLERNGYGNYVNMDKLVYKYGVLSNKLKYISDEYGDVGFGDIRGGDPDDTESFFYNSIGQLDFDASDNHHVSYEYDARGKTSSVRIMGGTSSGTANYYYDDMGFRSTTELPDGSQTFYIRDLSGNIMAIYDNTSTTAAKEYPIYGSGRIGVTFGNDGVYTNNYELTDHLGNVRAVISKTKSENVDILSYADYYPFGWKMPGRTASSSNGYRFGYQGQFAEEDQETGLNQFEARLYDARLGRWLTPDPARSHWSSYLAMGNNPLKFGDPDGRDIIVVIDRQGAALFDNGPAPGHVALLIGNDNKGWTYISKNGGVHGDLFNAESDKTIKGYPTADDFFKANDNGEFPFDYDEAVRITSTEKQDLYAKVAGINAANKNYHLLNASCDNTVCDAIKRAKGYGFNALIPKMTMLDLYLFRETLNGITKDPRPFTPSVEIGIPIITKVEVVE